MTGTETYRAIAKNLREFGYPDVTPLMIEEVWYAMQNGEAIPHGVVGMFAKSQLTETLGEPDWRERPDVLGPVNAA
jgi:hypothetical protein